MQTMTPTSPQTRITASRPICHYALGNTDAEHERLIRQAVWLLSRNDYSVKRASAEVNESWTSALASETSPCWQPLLAGSSGEVVGVEGDPRSVARAKARVAEAGLHNVRFMQSRVDQIASDKPFDAVLGGCRWRIKDRCTSTRLATFIPRIS